MLVKHLFEPLEGLSPLLAPGASEDGHLAAGAALGELQLAFTDLLEVSASLDEGFVLGEDAVILFPARLAGAILYAPLNLRADLFPLAAALNALIEVAHALLDVAAEHVLDYNLASASRIDLVADLRQKALHALRGRVVLAQLPDDSHTGEDIRNQAWDLSRLGLLNLAARILQDL